MVLSTSTNNQLTLLRSSSQKTGLVDVASWSVGGADCRSPRDAMSTNHVAQMLKLTVLRGFEAKILLRYSLIPRSMS